MQRTLSYPELADPMVRPRFTGIPTFMRLPYVEDLSGLDIALVGVPFDGGVTNRPGARHGPREIRNHNFMQRHPIPVRSVAGRSAGPSGERRSPRDLHC
jgi:guanidinopropionase